MGDPKKKKRQAKNKKKAAGEQSLLARYIRDWVFRDPLPSASDDFAPPPVAAYRAADRVVFEFHSHSKYSDGFLSPSALVERAHRNGVSPERLSFTVRFDVGRGFYDRISRLLGIDSFFLKKVFFFCFYAFCLCKC